MVYIIIIYVYFYTNITISFVTRVHLDAAGTRTKATVYKVRGLSAETPKSSCHPRRAILFAAPLTLAHTDVDLFRCLFNSGYVGVVYTFQDIIVEIRFVDEMSARTSETGSHHARPA